MLKKPDTDVPPDVVNSSLKCAVCERSSPEDGGNLKACAACLLVHYCSKKCQTADWKKHKSDCRPIVTTRRDVVTTRRADPTNEIDLQTGFFKNAFPDNICIFCGIRPTTFPTEASRREYSEISRICPSCWHVDVFDPDSTFEEFERSRRELHACGRILIIQKNPPHAWQCLCCREVIWNKQQCRIHAAKKCTTDLNILRQRNEVGVNYEMRTLKQNMAKTELFTQWSNLSDEGVRALVESLKQNTSLIKLIIEFTNNGDMGARAMMESLKHNTTLIELACHWSSITGEGARGLAESLKRNTTLTKLDLAFNKIGDQGARSLAECLKQNTTLIELVLWKNDIGDEGAHALAELLLQNKTLTELELWKNEIGDQGACALAESLKKNKTLISLSLRQNGIGDRGARALADSLKPNTTLIELCLQVNGIGEQGARALAKALKQNKTLKTSGWEWLEWCLKA
ncbi:hypothetical protein BC936DRAFT_140501 [Jimgerdemannia flammicorona]|uniref:MYND-type domain-containing protein n=1 Tax=Jimgerdemannia flammicorona TaxID=994334 RepID=A0A433DGT9_9FUNG|nr:hypothetical protein BC936DRAFT_140501 [Jimgerdemannia flammicorona]